MDNFSEFFSQYQETALWSDTDESGTPLECHYDQDSFSSEADEAMLADCRIFFDAHKDKFNELEPRKAAHSFWLTRNKHGAGFLDGDYPNNGEALAKACKSMGEVTIYVGGDGQIHHHRG